MKRTIKIDHTKCTGCRYCEAACSLKHNSNKVNPKKSRIRVFLDEDNDRYLPIIAGPFSHETEGGSGFCLSIGGKEYDQSTLWQVSRSSENWFREPETGNLLKCDFCGKPPNPHCVKVCASGALIFIEE